jgi:flagellar biosynthesis GTPase FlhF
MTGLTVAGKAGTFMVLGAVETNGKMYHILRSEQFGEDAEDLAVDEEGRVISDPLPYGSREEVIDAEDRQEAGDSEKDHSVYPEGMTREKQWQAETLAEENQGWEQENRRVRQRESVIERLEEKKREIRDLKPLPREVSEKTWESPPAITELEKKNTGS